MGVSWKKAERDVAKELQDWWRRLEPRARFSRTPGSGGWATARAFDGARAKMRGDVTVVSGAVRWPFSVEVKFRDEVTPGAIERFLVGQRSVIDRWWRQCCAAAEKDGLRPLLVFRGDRMPWRVVYQEAGEERPRLRLLSTLVRYDPEPFAKSSRKQRRRPRERGMKGKECSEE